MKAGRPKSTDRTYFHHFTTPLVHAVGDELRARVEIEKNAARIDHVWIAMDPGLSFRLLISINTRSLLNETAGFDGRVSLGSVRGTWQELPGRGITECAHFSYEEVEGVKEVSFVPMERLALEQALLERAYRATLLEVWGVPYHRKVAGIHEIHSRRASCAVPHNVLGQDGALRFYFNEENRWELLLFKFCGQ